MENIYQRDECFHDALVLLKDLVEKYKNEEGLEIEFRLGYINNDEFKTNIGKEFFDKITTKMSSVNMKSTHEQTKDFFHNGKRLSYNIRDITDGNDYDTKGTCIIKEKLATVDFIFAGTGFDVRVSFSKETPTTGFPKDKASYTRTKDRTSYFHGNISYDFTKVTTKNNTVDIHVYEVELEIKNLDLEKFTSHYLIHDSLLKLKDIVQMCEDIDEDAKLVQTKEKTYH